MSIKTIDDLNQVYMIYKSNKKSIVESKPDFKGTILFQFSIANMSEDKSRIENIVKKFNVVKISYVKDNFE